VLNTFVFGMSVGYHFIESSTGSCNGNFVGIGADCCTNSSVQVDSSDPWGILITNGEFTSFSFGADTPQDHTQVVVSASNAGAVSFVNSAFWGPSHKIASSSGKASSSLSFDSCVFNEWDSKGTGQPAILSNGGDLQVRGCTFQRSHPGGQVVLGAGSLTPACRRRQRDSFSAPALSGVKAGSPASIASRLRAASIAIPNRDERVPLPICGVSTILGASSNA
jgi:hypothetical protein